MLDYKKILEGMDDLKEIKEVSESKLYKDYSFKFLCTFDYLGNTFELFIPQAFPIKLPKITSISKIIHSHISYEGIVCLPNQEDIDYDLSDLEGALIKTMNSFKNLFSNSEDTELKEIEFEFNDYLPYYSNYSEKECYLCSSNVKDKGQFVIEEDKILIGIDSILYKNYIHKSDKPNTRLNFTYLELSKLPKVSYELKPKEIYDCLTEASLEKIKKLKKNVVTYFLLAYKLENGIYNYIFIKIIANLGKSGNHFLAEESKLTVFSVRDISFKFLRTRGGSQQIDDKVLVVGCGSVGSEVVDIMASSGFMDITIIDKDKLKYENTFRNSTGFYYLNKLEEYSKVSVIKKYIEMKYPDVRITTYEEDLVDFLYSGKASLELFKYIIICTGNNVLQKFINNYIYEKNIKTKLLFTWLEPYGIAEHILAVDSSKCGCYNCLCKSKNNIHFASEGIDYKIRNNVCSGSYTPYGRISTVRLATLISEMILNEYNNHCFKNQHIVKKGNFDTYLEKNYTLTEYAKFTEEQLKRMSSDFIFEGCEICGKYNIDE